MKHTSGYQVKLASIAVAAVATAAGLTIGAARAAPPPPPTSPTFTTATITVNSVGFLECAFKEAGLDPNKTVDYTCGATDVGWITQCFVKNKPVANIPPKLHVAHAADGLVTTQDRTASNRGTVSSSILTAYPSVEEEVGPPLCPETEGLAITEEVTAIRWCNGSLMDVTNNLSGASAPELFLQMTRNGASNVPSCDVLPTLPTDI